MVRISDLVKGKIPASLQPGSGAAERIRLSNLVESPKIDETPLSPLPSEGSTEWEAPQPADAKPDTRGKGLYLEAENYLREVRENLVAGKPLLLERPLAVIDRMIADPALVDEMYQLTVEIGQGDDMYLTSPINSMIYSYKIGVRMGYSQAPPKLTEVCLAALHHDIGMFLVPEGILHKQDKLTDEEFAVVRRHTETGRNILAALNHPHVARAVYEHHERENGQGYPQGLKGEEICEYAKIIGICDSYEAMTHNRPHRKAAAQYLSVLELAGTKARLFAPSIVKIFLDEITLYPIGSYVRLNNKAIGIVVETNPSNPLKPTIRIVVDGHGNRVSEEKLINLAGNTILTIVAGVAADEMPVRG